METIARMWGFGFGGLGIRIQVLAASRLRVLQ